MVLEAAGARRRNEPPCTEKAPKVKRPAQARTAGATWHLGLDVVPGPFIPLFPNLAAFHVAMTTGDQRRRELIFTSTFQASSAHHSPASPDLVSTLWSLLSVDG